MSKKNFLVIMLVFILAFTTIPVFAATTFTLDGDCGQHVFQQNGRYYCYYEGVSIASRSVDYIEVTIDAYEDGVFAYMDAAYDEDAQTTNCQSGNLTWEEGHIYQVYGDHYAYDYVLLGKDEASTSSYWGF